VCHAVLLAAMLCGLSALAQQLAFSTRGDLTSPIRISSVTESKVYGFDSVVVTNDSDQPVAAIRLVVKLGADVVEERRFPVELLPHDARRVTADLGHISSLRQKLGAGHEAKGLAVLSVKQVEFQNGASWDAGEPVEGIPVQGVDAPWAPGRRR
jgi:hypothetical protein